MTRFAEKHGIATVPVEKAVVGEAAAGFNHTLAHYLKLAKGTYAGPITAKRESSCARCATLTRPLSAALSRSRHLERVSPEGRAVIGSARSAA